VLDAVYTLHTINQSDTQVTTAVTHAAPPRVSLSTALSYLLAHKTRQAATTRESHCTLAAGTLSAYRVMSDRYQGVLLHRTQCFAHLQLNLPYFSLISGHEFSLAVQIAGIWRIAEALEFNRCAGCMSVVRTRVVQVVEYAVHIL
jgi:hypothetical protein